MRNSKRCSTPSSYLCWGEDPDAQRIDRMLSNDDFRISGLGESVIMKLLAITHPETYIPGLPLPRSQMESKQMIRRYLNWTRRQARAGEIQVASNTVASRSASSRSSRMTHWGMSWFLYWYLARLEEPETDDDRDVIGELADELLIAPSLSSRDRRTSGNKGAGGVLWPARYGQDLSGSQVGGGSGSGQPAVASWCSSTRRVPMRTSSRVTDLNRARAVSWYTG